MTAPTPGPVFVAGLERTGTSLMYALLAGHPDIAMTRRTNLWRYFYNQFGDLSAPENLDKCLGVMQQYKRLVKLDTDWVELRADFVSGPSTYPRLFDLIENQYASRLGKSRWGDKSLLTERHAAEIIGAYPGVSIIHMIRDPRDRYASVQKRWEKRLGGVGAGTAQWRFSVGEAEKNQRRFPGQYRVLRYEDLVADPEPQLRDICAFIGAEYHDDMLSLRGAEDFRKQGSNSSYGSRGVGVISTDSIGRFPEVLSPSQIRYIERAAAQPMERFGYQPSLASDGLVGNLVFTLGALPLESVRMISWGVRDRMLDRFGRRIPAHRYIGSGSDA